MSSRPPVLSARHKIVPLSALVRAVRQAQRRGKKVVFTNGCFDLIHAGHVKVLERARDAGDLLVVAVNSDSSVRVLKKGPGRPILHERDRALLIAAFACVDYVTIFSQATPQSLIEKIHPDVLIKGSDWKAGSIVGADWVRKCGGKVVRIPLLKGHSTTNLIERIRQAAV